MNVRRRDVSAMVVANVFYENKCLWTTSNVTIQRMFAWSVFLLSSWGPESYVGAAMISWVFA